MREQMRDNYCNELHIQYDAESGCTFLVGLNTVYGDRGNGGTRMLSYPTEEAAFADLFRLVGAMTRKCVFIGKKYNGGFSGGKGVIFGDPQHQKNPDMLRRYGNFVSTLNGRFVTGTDLNINLEDIEFMAETSPYIDGRASGLGDTGIPTGYGVYLAMKFAAKTLFGSPRLEGKRIVVQGVGSVGESLVHYLVQDEAIVIATDTDTDRLRLVSQKYNLESVSPEHIFEQSCDFFSPNAVGGTLTDEAIDVLQCRAIIGGANNPLADGMRSAEKLLAKGILYFPDYVINIGGVFLSMCEAQQKDYVYLEKTLEEIIETNLQRIFAWTKSDQPNLLACAESIVAEELGGMEKRL